MTATALKKVLWCSSISHYAQLHGDYGTLCHLTRNGDKTLCGKRIPSDLGHPAPDRFCRRCLKSGRRIEPYLDLAQIAWHGELVTP